MPACAYDLPNKQTVTIATRLNSQNFISKNGQIAHLCMYGKLNEKRTFLVESQ